MMVKKLLTLFAIIICSVTFSQEKEIERISVAPNPFSNHTKISFTVSSPQDVMLTIKNVLGKVVCSKSITAIAGENSVPFYRDHLKSGMYIYAIQTDTSYIFKRFVIK